MAFFTLTNTEFKRLKQLEQLEGSLQQIRKIKKVFLDRVIQSIDYIRWNRSAKTIKVLDEIFYKSAARGFSWCGREHLMKKAGCGKTTVDTAFRAMKDSEEVIVAYLPNKKSNGVGTPVVILKDHMNFNAICDILGQRFTTYLADLEMRKREVEREVKAAQIRLHYWLGLDKKVSIIKDNSSLKKINKYINHLSFDLQNIVKAFTVKVEEYRQKGFSITHLDKFAAKLLESFRRSAIYKREKDEIKLRKQVKAIIQSLGEAADYDCYDEPDNEWEQRYKERSLDIVCKLAKDNRIENTTARPATEEIQFEDWDDTKDDSPF